MDSPLHPQDLKQWVALLQDKQLPVPAQTLGLLRRQLEDTNVSVQQLQPIIRRDPVLSMHCVSLANRLNRNPDTDVSTIELAVATLGLNRITELAQKLPAIKLNNASVPHKQYFHALGDSYHAATQAAMLCRYKDPTIINNTRTAALLYGVGHWALWRYAPQQMSQIKIRIYEQQQDTALAEYEVLGCTIQDISEQLAKLWQLSRLAAEALQHSTSPDADLLQQIHLQAEHSPEVTDEKKRQVKQLLNAPFYPVKLANWLALTVPMGWSHPKSLRIVGFISDFLQRPLDQTSLQLHQNCVTASHQHPMPDLLSPASLMLLLPSELVLNYRMETGDLDGDAAKNKLDSIISPKKFVAIKALATRKQANAASAQRQPLGPDPLSEKFRDEALYQQCLQQLLKPSEELQKQIQALKLFQQGVIQGIGLERIVCFSIDTEMSLAPICHQGCASTPLATFTHNLKIPSLMKKMTRRPLAVWVHTENRARIWTELPERFKSVCHAQSFVLISLFEAKQPTLLLYADRDQQDTLISEFQFKKLKQLAVAVNHCIHQLNIGTH